VRIAKSPERSDRTGAVSFAEAAAQAKSANSGRNQLITTMKNRLPACLVSEKPVLNDRRNLADNDGL
jgi:hypothetical protein